MIGLDVSGSALAMSAVHSLILAGIGLVVVILALGAVVLLLRRRLLNSTSSPSEEAFTLEDLRSLRDSGQISQEEYERARQQIVTHMSLPGTDAAAKK